MDTNSTTSQIRIQLITLDDFMVIYGHDISNFNGNFKVLFNSLKARGEKIYYILTNIFKGYIVCSNKVFVKYITRKQKWYKEGIYIIPYNLMHLSMQKFKLLNTINKWNAPP